jgi:uncharacterized membrane protein (DUF106 family)
MVTEFMQSNPRISIILVSLLVTVFITTVRYFMVDRDKLKEIKERQKELRKEVKKYKDNPEKMLELNQQMLEDMPEQFKQSFKPMLITMIPVLILFKWMWSIYGETALSGTSFLFPVWLWWYIGSSIIFSIALNKGLGLQ